MMKLVPVFSATLATAGVFVLSAAAAAGEPPAIEPLPPGVPPAPPLEAPPAPPSPEVELATRLLTTVRGLGEMTFRANLDDNAGDVAVTRVGTGIGIAGPLSERLRLNVNLESEFSWYDFNDAAGIVPGADEPIEDAFRLVLRPQLVVLQSKDFSWYVGGILESAGTYDADFGETISGGGFGGVRYRINDDLAVSLGLGAKTRLEDSALVLPLIGVEWKLSETVTIVSEGLGATIEAQLNDDWWFLARGGWELRDYRLDSDGPLPDGVLSDERVPIGVGFAWRPSPGVSVELIGGAVMWQQYTVDDSDGVELSDLNTDPTGFIRLTGRITF